MTVEGQTVTIVFRNETEGRPNINQQLLSRMAWIFSSSWGRE
jgi:hypothetical protein